MADNNNDQNVVHDYSEDTKHAVLVRILVSGERLELVAENHCDSPIPVVTIRDWISSYEGLVREAASRNHIVILEPTRITLDGQLLERWRIGSMDYIDCLANQPGAIIIDRPNPENNGNHELNLDDQDGIPTSRDYEIMNVSVIRDLFINLSSMGD